jgi:GST-like protein
MPDLSALPITRRWPPRHPDRLQLDTLGTPSGPRVPIAREALGLPDKARRVDFGRGDQLTPGFLSLNPNQKIPAIRDRFGPGMKPLPRFQSGAIRLCLADRTGRRLPTDPGARWQAVQWLMVQMGGVGPMFGQLRWFNTFDGRLIEDKRGHQRCRAETARRLRVLDCCGCSTGRWQGGTGSPARSRWPTSPSSPGSTRATSPGSRTSWAGRSWRMGRLGGAVLGPPGRPARAQRARSRPRCAGDGAVDKPPPAVARPPATQLASPACPTSPSAVS